MKTKLWMSIACIMGLIACSTIFGRIDDSMAQMARNESFNLTSSLSTAEAEWLTFMREEEKLARDVYIAMYQKWKAVVFSNIFTSEQTHMDTLKKKLDKYTLPDPAQAELGKFTNPVLQAKYDQLVFDGLQSLIKGLYAGATIEEIDIVDLQSAIDDTTHLDVVNIYQNLLEGSKNHLCAYVKVLKKQGVTYEPQYLGHEDYDEIIGNCDAPLQ